MQISDIPAHLGVSAKHLADLMGKGRQALNNYTSGRKGKPSKFVSDLLAVANLNREEIIFPNVFDHPDGDNPAHPDYWLSIAAEAVREAEKRGLPADQAESIRGLLAQAALPLLSEIETLNVEGEPIFFDEKNMMV